MVNRILVPVDFTPRSAEAARYAAAIAAHFKAELQLVHVIEPAHFDYSMIEASPGPSREVEEASASRGRHALEEFAAEEVAGIQPSLKILHGDPAEQILCWSRHEKAGLIVMPTRGRSRIRQFLIGSVAAKVLHDSAVPVWTGVHLRSDANFPDFQLSSILCAIDFGSQSNLALRYAAGLASQFGASLTVIHVAASTMGDAMKRAEDLLAELRLPAAVRVEVGVPHKVVAATAGRTHADLVVIGRASGTGMVGRLREQAYSIIRDSPCPVVSV